MQTSIQSGATPLPPSPLRSAGLGLQESLQHYALRMAAQCCLSIRKFEGFLLRDDPRAAKAGNAIFPSSWIGPRSNFRALLAALKRDTGVPNLHVGTFHVVADVMGRGGTRRRQIRGEGRVWCPRCYLEWDDRTSSEPLVWAFDMLSACPVHSVRLESRCHICSAPQTFWAAYRKRRTCEVCKASLGHPRGVQESDKQALWINATLLQFTSWIEETDEPVTSCKYLQFLEAMRTRRSEAGGLPPVIRAYVDIEYGVRRRKQALPTVSTLINFAAFQGVAIEDLLCEPSFAASAHLAQGAATFSGVLFRRRDLQQPQRRVVYVLARLAANGGPLPPASVVWKQLGLWCDGVRDICPSEHSAFWDRFRAQARTVPMGRFKLGASSCMRLLEGLGGSTDAGQALRQHLRANHGFHEAAAVQCATACLSLSEALVMSSDEAELIAFELAKADIVARWAADGSHAT